MKSLKHKIYAVENFTYFFNEILVDAERLESAGPVKPDHLVYITNIFEDLSDSSFRLWGNL